MRFYNFINETLHFSGEHVQNGDHSDAHVSTFSHSSKEVRISYVSFLTFLRHTCSFVGPVKESEFYA